MADIFIGTSGFLYSHWIGDFYPENLKRENFLSFYAKHFQTVEINSSFYHLPRQKTVENWLKQVPKDFIFSFKMSRFVSHFGKLDPKVKSFPLFFEAIKPLAVSPTKHLVLIQTPSSFKVNAKKLKNFLKHLPQKFLYAFEFRHQSWFCKEVYEILKKHNAAVVLADSPIKRKSEARNPKSETMTKIQNQNDQNVLNFENSNLEFVSNFDIRISDLNNRLWPYVAVGTASFFYIRFHGSKQLFASSYSDEELKFYAMLIKEKIKRGMKVYCYFNNDAEGAAVSDAKRLLKFLS